MDDKWVPHGTPMTHICHISNGHICLRDLGLDALENASPGQLPNLPKLGTATGTRSKILVAMNHQ